MEDIGEISIAQLTSVLSDWLNEHEEFTLLSKPRAYAVKIRACCNGQVTLTVFCCHLLSQETAKRPKTSAEEFGRFLKDSLCELLMQEQSFSSKLHELDHRRPEAAILTNVSALHLVALSQMIFMTVSDLPRRVQYLRRYHHSWSCSECSRVGLPSLKSSISARNRGWQQIASLQLLKYESLFYEMCNDSQTWLRANGFIRKFRPEGRLPRIQIAAPIVKTIILKHKGWSQPTSWLAPATPWVF